MAIEKSTTIYHFDDEPDTVDWIPGVLENRLIAANRSCAVMRGNSIVDAEDLEGEMQQVTLTIECGAVVQIVVYCLCDTQELFESKFAPKEDDIVLLDLVCEQEDGELLPVAGEYYNRAVSVIGDERVLIHTAFPNEVASAIGKEVAADAITIKPADATALADRLMELIGAQGNDQS